MRNPNLAIQQSDQSVKQTLYIDIESA
jgi:hypothetical protein